VTSKYQIYAYYRIEDRDGDCNIDDGRDTLAEAKAFARRALTAEYQNVIEASERLTFAEVWRGRELLYEVHKPEKDAKKNRVSA
jgi:hypothetical protein